MQMYNQASKWLFKAEEGKNKNKNKKENDCDLWLGLAKIKEEIFAEWGIRERDRDRDGWWMDVIKPSKQQTFIWVWSGLELGGMWNSYIKFFFHFV